MVLPEFVSDRQDWWIFWGGMVLECMFWTLILAANIITFSFSSILIPSFCLGMGGCNLIGFW